MCIKLNENKWDFQVETAKVNNGDVKNFLVITKVWWSQILIKQKLLKMQNGMQNVMIINKL